MVSNRFLRLVPVTGDRFALHLLVAAEPECHARFVGLPAHLFAHRDPMRCRVHVVLRRLHSDLGVFPLPVDSQCLDDRLRIGTDLIRPALDGGILDREVSDVGDVRVPVAHVLRLLDDDP